MAFTAAQLALLQDEHTEAKLAVNINIAAPTNLLSNPGFETAGGGGADIWADWTESAADGALANETTNVRSGDDACKITAGASLTSRVKAVVTTVAGQQYKLGFWARGDGTYDGRFTIRDSTHKTDIVSLEATGVTGAAFAEVTRSFVAPAGCVEVAVLFYCPSTASGVCYVDDVTMYREFRYCSGTDAVKIGDDWYTPRPLEGDEFALADPRSARTSITIGDQDGVVRTAYYAERFSGSTATVYLLLRKPPVQTWSQVTSVAWKCENCEDVGDGWFRVNLSGASGHRQRAGLRIGTRSEFNYAPEPGETLHIGGEPATWGPAPDLHERARSRYTVRR